MCVRLDLGYSCSWALIVIHIGLWALEEPLFVAWIFVLCLWFVVLLRSCRLPSASQLGKLFPLRHGADIGQTQLGRSLLRCKSRTAACPSSSCAARQRSATYLRIIWRQHLRVRHGMVLGETWQFAYYAYFPRYLVTSRARVRGAEWLPPRTRA